MIEKVSFLCFSSGILNELILFFVLFVFRADADSSDYHYNQPKFIVFYKMLLNFFCYFASTAKKITVNCLWFKMAQWSLLGSSVPNASRDTCGPLKG